MIVSDITVPGELFAAVLTLFILGGVGMTGWILSTIVKLLQLMAALTARVEGLEKRGAHR